MRNGSSRILMVVGAGSGRGAAAWLLALVGGVLLAGGALAPGAAAVGTVDLGTAASYSVLGGQTVTNTGPSTLSGDLGVSPGTAITGFPPGQVGGVTHAADAQALQAQSDLVVAYNDTAGRAPTANIAGDLVGTTDVAGVYKSSGPINLTGTLTLDGQGDPNAVFIFQIASTLITGSASYINMINGAQACHVFWQVGSSATLGTASVFRGTIMALTSISVTTGAVVEGRALARNGAVTLDNDTFTPAQCGATTPATSTTTTESVPTAPVTAGDTVPVATTVVGSGTAVPTGTVTVLLNGVAVGTATLDSTGHATVDAPTGSTAGNVTITSRYNGDLKNLPSTSAPSTIAVHAPATSSAATTTAAGSTAAGTTAAGTTAAGTTAAGTTAAGTTAAGSRGAATSTAGSLTSSLAATGATRVPGLSILSAAALLLGIACTWAARRRHQGHHRLGVRQVRH